MGLGSLTVSYGDISLAGMGIVLKLEHIPINTGLGICLGMVPLVAYNYGAGNTGRMKQFFKLAGSVIFVFSCLCTITFWFFAEPLIGAFISDRETIMRGIEFLR